MLKINIIAVGKDKDKWVSEGCAHYKKLLSRFADLSFKIIPAHKQSSSIPRDQIKKEEGRRILHEIKKGTTIALADTGQKKDSTAFSKMLDKLQQTSGGTVNFIIGGAYGLDEAVLSHADTILSLSPLTFPHQLVRLTLLEQLYRGFSILHGTDYHK